jgi:hypothetical protein
MAKGHTIGRTVTHQMEAEAARIYVGEVKAQKPYQEEVERPTAPRAPLNNLDRLVNWSNDFLSRQNGNQVYPIPITRN